MRNMSFMHTTQQFRDRTKTVTRRAGWWNLKPGELVMAVKQCQGLRKGERIEKLGVIRIVGVCQTRLDDITPEDCVKEGFPHLSPRQFMSLFMSTHKGCTPATTINRIEFEYIDSQPTATEQCPL